MEAESWMQRTEELRSGAGVGDWVRRVKGLSKENKGRLMDTRGWYGDCQREGG